MNRGKYGSSNIKLDSHASSCLNDFIRSLEINHQTFLVIFIISTWMTHVFPQGKCIMCKLRLLSGIDSMEIFLIVFLRADFGADFTELANP